MNLGHRSYRRLAKLASVVATQNMRQSAPLNVLIKLIHKAQCNTRGSFLRNFHPYLPTARAAHALRDYWIIAGRMTPPEEHAFIPHFRAPPARVKGGAGGVSTHPRDNASSNL